MGEGGGGGGFGGWGRMAGVREGRNNFGLGVRIG